MKTLIIKGVALGEGRPKICLPLTGRTEEELICQAEEAVKESPDLLEWRAKRSGRSNVRPIGRTNRTDSFDFYRSYQTGRRKFFKFSGSIRETSGRNCKKQ